MAAIEIKNLFDDIQDSVSEEVFETILDNNSFKLEKIVSTGQSTPVGEWYDQEADEWVIMLTGSAGLSFKGHSGIRVIKPGDYLLIPAHTIHRVEWTDSNEKTIWLAIHYPVGQKL
jgi:cupin 2 domain-containing protein